MPTWPKVKTQLIIYTVNSRLIYLNKQGVKLNIISKYPHFFHVCILPYYRHIKPFSIPMRMGNLFAAEGIWKILISPRAGLIEAQWGVRKIETIVITSSQLVPFEKENKCHTLLEFIE